MPILFSRFALAVLLALATLVPGLARPQTSVATMSVRELRAGMKGYGVTVFHGTTLEKFPVTILGVVKNYIAESDLILIRVDGGYPAQHGVGIIAGMSGSPVYIDGRLIGAVAYGWPFSKEPIGGVTPIESMLKELPGQGAADNASVSKAGLSPGPRVLSTPIQVSDRLLKRIQVVPNSGAARTLGASPDTLVLSPVPSLFQVSGFGERAFEGISKVLKPLNMEPVRTFASAPPAHAQIPAMLPGAAVGVQFLTGDLEIAGTGTLTYVDGKRFLAFGHPMAQLGDVTLPMTAAYVQGVLPSYQRPFKFASQIGMVGQLQSDRLWAVGGTFGPSAPMIPVTIHMNEPAHHLEKTYHLRAIQHRFLTPVIVTQAMMEGLNSLVPAGAESTAIVNYHIKPRGRDMLEMQQMVAGVNVEGSVAMQFNEYLAQLTNNDFAPLALDSVDVDVKIMSGKRTATIDNVYTTRSTYHRGDMVDVHVVLHPYGGSPFEKVVSVPIPSDMDKGQVLIGVSGGTDVAMLRKRLAQAKPEPTNIHQLLELMVNQERGQQLIVKAAYPSKSAVVGQERFSFLPESLREVLPGLPQSDVNPEKDVYETRVETDWVVRGADVINADVTVPTDSSDKKKTADVDGITVAKAGGEAAEPAAVGVKVAAAAAPAAKKAEPAKKETDTTTSGDKVLPSGTRRWDLHDAAAFSQGTFDGTSLSSDGNISLGSHNDRLLDAGGSILWSLARDPRDGTVLAGTASEGRVLRLVPTPAAATGPDTWGTKSTLKVGDAAVTAIAVASDGTTWLGTAPRGRVYRKPPGGEATLVHDDPASYIWALVPQADGSVLVGTGNPGRLLSISRDGETRVLASFSERHVRVIVGTPGDLLVATANPGVVYHLAGAHRDVLFTTPFGSVDGLLRRRDGEVVAASGRALYRLRPQGRVRVVAVSDKPLLGLTEGSDGTLVAAGANGKAYRIDDQDVVTRIADFQGGPIMALVAVGDGVLAATASPGSVLRLSGQVRNQGLWTSEVLDAGSGARWGRVRWMTEGSGTVTLQSRSGYTPAPDDTWSAWSVDYTASTGTPIGSPPGRYMQLRAHLTSTAAEAPRLSTVSVYFHNDDLQPAVEISHPFGGERWAATRKVQWKAVGAGVDAMAYDLSYSSDGKNWTSIQKGLGPSVKETAVNATSGAGDTTQNEEYSWDTTKIGDGVYRLRIETYDAARPDASRTVVTSKPFVVTNTAPKIDGLTSEKLPDGRTRWHGTARSHLAAVVSVTFKVSGRDWQVARADDGFYDSESEPFSFIVSNDSGLEIRVNDEAGNVRTVHR